MNKVKSLSRVRLFATPWTVAYQAPPSMGVSRKYEYSGLIFFRIDFFDLFAVQGTLKSFLQHHSWKASIHSLLSNSDMTTEKAKSHTWLLEKL